MSGQYKGCATTQGNLVKLENGVKVYLMKSNKGKCKVLHLERNNCRH